MVQQTSMIGAILGPGSGTNAKLDKIAALIDWPRLVPLLSGVRNATTGAPPFVPLGMLKAVYLQAMYDLPDPGPEDDDTPSKEPL